MGKIATGVSDLHREFGDHSNLELPGGDILLLAGDIFTSAGMRKGHLRYEYIKFCKEELRKYKIVLYVMGNHDYYHDIFEEAPIAVKSFLAEYAPNVRLVENECITIDGVSFLCCTMWTPAGTDCGRAHIVGALMNDFNLIYTRDAQGKLAQFKPIHAAMEHKKSVEFLRRELERRRPVYGRRSAVPCVVMTHHAPSFKSDNEKRSKDDYGYGSVKEGWCADVEYLMKDNPHLVRWIHGHTHRNTTYNVSNTTVSANCQGYPGKESVGFKPISLQFDLDDVKERAFQFIKEERRIRREKESKSKTENDGKVELE